MFCIVSLVFEGIGEMFTFSVAFAVAFLRTWVGTCMHEALFQWLMLGVLLVLIQLTNPCMCCIYGARLLRGGLGIMQTVRVIESGFECGYMCFA